MSKKTIIETHPQPRPVKTLRLEGVKPLELPSAFFPKAQSSQSKAKNGAEMEAWGTQNHWISQKRAHQKIMKDKITKSWSESRF